jgi:hypothetical protein
VGLPLYRPDIGALTPENVGSSFVDYTFHDDDFLPDLLQECRKHKVSITSATEAALFLTVHDLTDMEPEPTDEYNAHGSVDLRKSGGVEVAIRC